MANVEIKFKDCSTHNQNTDYIKLDGFIAYLQNFTNVMSSEELKKPIMFGLKNMTTQVVLEISY